MRFLLTLTLLSVCCVSLAAPPLTITKSGYYLTYLDAKGVPSLEKITTVVDLSGTTDPPTSPFPPTKPKVGLDLTVVRDSQAWAKSVDDALTAQAISLVYDQVMGAQQDGLVNAVTVWSVLKVATDNAISIVGSKKDWEPYRDKLSDLVTLGRQKGTLSTTESITILLNSLRQGLEQAADGSPELDLSKSVAIIKRTNEVIDDSRK